ncbi:hypothetical protein [Microbacterium sp. 3J1]|uniref:hypothetical protein n=1 Tax=Microbacterium sp. 3J1 TaxID=861269 RepID=UPI000AD22435|nr:hypothetical protein [Microbacterium sp. 3J1]
MKTLITQVGTYVTGDAVADAVVQHWLALTEERRGDVVEIPFVGPDGRRSRVRLAMGAALPIAVVDAETVDGFDDEAAAHALLNRTHSLSPSASVGFDAGDLPDVHSEYDLLT